MSRATILTDLAILNARTSSQYGSTLGPASVPNPCRVDPVAGNDANAGTVASPLKTLTEFARRFRPAASAALPCIIAQQVQLASSPVTSDRPVFDFYFDQDGHLDILGDTTNLRTGTLTNVVAKNRATNTALGLVDTGTTWATSVGKFVRFTSGTGLVNGAACIVRKDLGANTASVSTLGQTPADFLGYRPAPAPSSTLTPVIGNTYVVFNDFPTISNLMIYAQGKRQYALFSINFFHCKLAITDVFLEMWGNVGFWECQIDRLSMETGVSTVLNLLNCRVSPSGGTVGGDRFHMAMGMILNAPSQSLTARIRAYLEQDVMVQNSLGFNHTVNQSPERRDIIIGDNNDIDDVSVFESAAFLTATNGDHFQLPTNYVWGSGNTDCSLKILTGALVNVGAGAAFPIAGGGGGYNDIKIGDGTVTTSRPFDNAGGVYAAAANLTWANFVGATFNRKLNDPLYGNLIQSAI